MVQSCMPEDRTVKFDGNFVDGAKCEILRIWLAIHALQSSLEVRYVLMKPRFAIYVVQRSLEAEYTIIRPRFLYARHDVIQ